MFCQLLWIRNFKTKQVAFWPISNPHASVWTWLPPVVTKTATWARRIGMGVKRFHPSKREVILLTLLRPRLVTSCFERITGNKLVAVRIVLNNRMLILSGLISDWRRARWVTPHPIFGFCCCCFFPSVFSVFQSLSFTLLFLCFRFLCFCLSLPLSIPPPFFSLALSLSFFSLSVRAGARLRACERETEAGIQTKRQRYWQIDRNRESV